MASYDNVETMEELVALTEEVHSDQRRYGIPELQLPSEVATDAWLQSLTKISSMRSSRHRWGKYVQYCQEHTIPQYPIRPCVVALSLYDLAEGNTDAGKAYDANTSALNSVRKRTTPFWKDRDGCEDYEDSIMTYEPLRQFCTVARKSARRLRDDKVLPSSSSAKHAARRQHNKPSPDTPNTPTDHTAPSYSNLKRDRSPSHSGSDSTLTDLSESNLSEESSPEEALTKSPPSKRERRTIPVVEIPPTPKASTAARRRTASKPASAARPRPTRAATMAKAPDTRRSTRTSLAAAVSATGTPRRSVRVPGLKHRPVWMDESSTSEDDSSDDEEDEEDERGAKNGHDEMKMDEEAPPTAPEEMGMFGKIVKWFGWTV